ncbi:MAG: SurA N-terminal domain-containing protein [Bacillota bacterium]|nr:SurA N-terminal domain-containing protein [Bacillota bacterium]NLH87799.1 tetratricopeptide repeat protein [Bacillota bacterium]
MISGMRKRAGTIVAVIAGIVALGMIIPMLFAGSNANTAAARLTVAKVNSVKVTALDLALEFQQAYSRRVQSGGITPDDIEVLRSEAMDTVIEDALILDAAKEAGYVANQIMVDSAFEADKSYFSDEREFISALSNWGFTAKSYKEYLGRRQIIGSYPNVAAPVEVTDEEIQAEFDKVAATQPDLEYDDARDDIEQLIRYRKELANRETFIKDLREDAKIRLYDPRVLAYRAMADGDYDEAVKHYRKAIKQSPQDPYLQISLGKALAAAGKARDSQTAFESALKMAPEEPFVLIAQADNLRESGDTERARDLYQKASDLAGQDLTFSPIVHGLIRDAYTEMGMDDEAAQEEEKIAGIQEAARARWEEQLREALEAARAEKDADEGDAADDSGEVDDQPESAEDSTSVE